MALPTYQTGTVAIDTDGAVTVTGGIWTGNVVAGDKISVDGGSTELISDVAANAPHGQIAGWTGGAVTGKAYVVYKESSLRFEDVQLAEDLKDQVAALNTEGFYWFVPSVANDPDPSLGDDGQYAFQATTGKLWVKEGGVWTYVGNFKGISFTGAYGSGTTYNANDVATSGGSAYIWINATPGSGHAPPNATYWAVLASKGDTGSTGSTGPVPLKPIEAWVTATAYVAGPPASFVSRSGSAYECLVSHTSGTFNTDLAAGKWGLVAAKGTDGAGVGDVVGPGAATDSALVAFDGTTGKSIKELTASQVRGSIGVARNVRPIVVDMHWDATRGHGWMATQTGGEIDYTLASGASAGATSIMLTGTVPVTNELLVVKGTDGDYYSVAVAGVSGSTVTLLTPLPVAVAAGVNAHPWWTSEAHPTTYGARAIVAYAVRSRLATWRQVYKSQGTVRGTSTVVDSGSDYVTYPGSSTVRGNTVTPTAANSGIQWADWKPKRTGRYRATFKVSGGGGGALTFNVFSNGGQFYQASVTDGDCGLHTVDFTINELGTVLLTLERSSTAFFVSKLEIYEHTGFEFSGFGNGRHGIIGDSWVATSGFGVIGAFRERFPNATFVDLGVSGDKISDIYARFSADVGGDIAAHGPMTSLSLVVGTNDYFASVAPSTFGGYMGSIVARTVAFGVQPILFTPSVGSADVSATRFNLSRRYADEIGYYDRDLISAADAPRQNALLMGIYQSKSFAGFRRAINEFYDGYKASDGVDASSSGQAVNTTSGYVGPTSSGTTVQISAASTTAAAQGYTMIDRTTALVSSVVVSKIGLYSTVARSVTLKIVKRNSAGNYDVVANQTFSHTGSGWEDFTLTSPYTVPGSGSYYLAAYIPAGGSNPNMTANIARAYVMADMTGTGQTATEDSSSGGFPLRYVHTVTTSNMILVTKPQTSDASMSNGRVLIEYDNSATPTLNTDLTVEVTCNGGTNWAAATLASVTSYGQGGRSVAETNVQACTAGTSFAARVKTFNSKNVPVYGLSITAT